MVRFWMLLLLLQVLLAVHAIKRGKPWHWIIFIVMTPLLGCLVYLIVEVWPNLPERISFSSSDNYQVLVRKCGGNWDTADRMLQLELDRNPRNSRKQCIQNAIYRLDRDNR